MSERSEERRGEEEWRAGAQPENRPPRSRAWVVWLVVVVAATAAAALFLLR